MELKFGPYLRTMDLNKDDWRIKIKYQSGTGIYKAIEHSKNVVDKSPIGCCYWHGDHICIITAEYIGSWQLKGTSRAYYKNFPERSIKVDA